MTTLVAQLEGQSVQIPYWVDDLASFRRWVASDEFPERGQYSFLKNSLWVDGNMEKRPHSRIKSEITIKLGALVDSTDAGELSVDGVWLTNEEVGLSTEPDCMYASFESLKAGRLKFADNDSHEAVGTPDMVLEVMSPSSRDKDTVVLRELYHQAGIPEYWLVEPARSEDEVQFQILRWRPEGYACVGESGGWMESGVFGKSFRLQPDIDPIGQPRFRLEIR